MSCPPNPSFWLPERADMMVQAEENLLMTTRYPENSLDEPEHRKKAPGDRWLREIDEGNDGESVSNC